MNYRRFTFFLLVVAYATPAIAGGDIEIFTTAEYEIILPAPWRPYHEAGYRIVVFRLDDLNRITEELSVDLPDNPTRAAAVVQQRLATDGTTLQRRMRRVSAGLERSIALGISEYPAIVFASGEAVVYGETILTNAIVAYEQSGKRRP